MNAPVITLNTERNRFETTQDGHTAYLSFVRLPDGNLAYEHTIVPPELGGRGLGGKLAQHALDWAASQGVQVRPDCSFVQAYIERNPQYQPLRLA